MVSLNPPVFPSKQCSASSCCLSQGALISESLPAKASFLVLWGLGHTVLIGWLATQAGSVPHRQSPDLTVRHGWLLQALLYLSEAKDGS